MKVGKVRGVAIRVCGGGGKRPSWRSGSCRVVCSGRRTGNGSNAAPFGRIQDAIGIAQPGDTITIRPGTYSSRCGRYAAAPRPSLFG